MRKGLTPAALGAVGLLGAALAVRLGGVLAIALGFAASRTGGIAVDGHRTFGALTARAFALCGAAEFTVRGLTPIPALIPAPILASVAARRVIAGFAVFPGEGIERSRLEANLLTQRRFRHAGRRLQPLLHGRVSCGWRVSRC